MKKALCLILALALTLGATAALAAGKLVSAQENFWVVDGYWTNAYVFAKVENSGNKPININAGVMEVYDENGDAITSSDYLRVNAQCLQPGEYTYVSMSKEIENPETVTVDDYMLTVTGKTDDKKTTLRLPVSDMKLALQEEAGYWKRDYMYATVTNDTEETVYNISIVFALLDAEGNILNVVDDNLYSGRGLTPGSSIVFRSEISSTMMEFYGKNELTPASVDAIAYVDN